MSYEYVDVDAIFADPELCQLYGRLVKGLSSHFNIQKSKFPLGSKSYKQYIHDKFQEIQYQWKFRRSNKHKTGSIRDISAMTIETFQKLKFYEFHPYTFVVALNQSFGDQKEFELKPMVTINFSEVDYVYENVEGFIVKPNQTTKLSGIQVINYHIDFNPITNDCTLEYFFPVVEINNFLEQYGTTYSNRRKVIDMTYQILTTWVWKFGILKIPEKNVLYINMV